MCHLVIESLFMVHLSKTAEWSITICHITNNVMPLPGDYIV